MKKGTRIVKRCLALFLVVLMSINTLGAVVSDNDGSAFITKAEFDSLKNDFQSQIDQYNTSIDSKIDGAIASYLSGIRVGKTEKLELDTTSKYSFPLVMFLNNQLWNEPDSDYFDVNIPGLDYYRVAASAATGWARNNVGGDDKWQADQRLKLNQSPITLPATTDRSSGTTEEWQKAEKTVRAFFIEDHPKLDPIEGPMFQVQRTTNTRMVDGTDRVTFNLQECGRGYNNAFFRYVSMYDSMGDGGATSTNQLGVWEYINVVGMAPGNVIRTSGDQDFQYVTGLTNLIDTFWDHNSIRSFYFCFNGMPDGYMDYPNLANFNSLVTKWNNRTRAGTSMWNINTGIQRDPNNPFYVTTDWVETGKRHMLFAGTARMPGQEEKHWSVTPWVVDGAHPENWEFIKCHQTDLSSAKFWAWNFSGQDIANYGCLRPRRVWLFPNFRARDNTEWHDQVPSNGFSQLRASVVYYEDKNDKVHYLDEGMYLGTYEQEGKVSFKLRFNSTPDVNVRVALSKKPFGFDAVTSNRIKWTYKTGTSTATTTVNNGSYGTISTSNTITVNVEDINKNDQLYMIWWPENDGDYVELTSFTDYQIETSD